MKYLFALFPLLGFASEEQGIRRVQAHLLIEDPKSALFEAENLSTRYPHSLNCSKSFIEALAANGKEEQALDLWNSLAETHPDLWSDRHLLEELSWGVLKKGVQSTQYGVRLSGLVGAYLTQDVRAVPLILKMMRDTNAVIRSVAVQMSTSYRDAPLKDEIVRMMSDEKVWMVRLELIKAAGLLRIRELSDQLNALIQSEKTTFEERQLSIAALLEIYDKISLDEIRQLCKSNRAGLRHLACSIALHFEIEDAKEEILKLTQDSHPQVRIAALNALGLFYHQKMKKRDARKVLESALSDRDPAVAITACWAALRIDPKLGMDSMEKWLSDSLPENRRMAAAALATTGDRGTTLALETLKTSNDPYVKANIALGLLGQRLEIQKSCDILYRFLTEEKRLWMWESRPNSLFKILAPSQVRHIDQIPNYPEAIDQMTRLNLVSLLAIVEDKRALPALKEFLARKSWGITGVAAATLLREGDETAMEMVRQLTSDADSNVRLQACLVLAMFGRDESVIREIQEAYVGADHERKLHILEALGRIGNTESYRFLINSLKEPFPVLRVAAAAAMIQSVNR
jgi:HEAT repeat protein